MTTSPLKFARSFEQLKSRLQSTPAGDLSLLALVEFWPELKDLDSVAAYKSYFDEYLPLLLKSTTERNLQDLLPPELERLFEVTLDLRQSQSAQAMADEVEVCIKLVAVEAARKYFYVGDIDAGLVCLARAEAIEPPILPQAVVHPTSSRRAEPLSGSADEVTLSMSKGSRRAEPLGGSADAGRITRDTALQEEEHDLSEIDALRNLAQYLSDSNHEFADIVRRILRDWEVTREALSFEEVTCLFVEKNDHGDAVRGRLRLLHGTAEYRRAGAETAKNNEVSFDNQLRAPDDPFVGVVYDALVAVNRRAFTGRANGYVRARYQVVESDHTFTGDSIGLAAGLVAYTQLLQPELLKHERFLAYEAAFTGGVDAAGRLTPVNEATLHVKIERAFFSPIRYLVLPGENLDAAQASVAELQAKHPRRRLILVGANTIGEVIENRNIVRAEKVCMGQFVTRRVVKYSRATKIQVPILLALLYALICLIFPKAWIGFDRNPQYVQLTERGFDALNADSVRLWSVEYKCDSITARSQWEVGNLDRDPENEIAFAPHTGSICEGNATLFVYDHDGGLTFKQQGVIEGEYPGDSTIAHPYIPGPIDFIRRDTTHVIISKFFRSYPARTHIRAWEADGGQLGWYINAGFNNYEIMKCFEGTIKECFILPGFNNRMGCASLLSLNVDSCDGVSPPYVSANYELDKLKRGNQSWYALFPPSDLNRALNDPYNSIVRVVPESIDMLRVDVNESAALPPIVLSYYLNTKLRAVMVKADDRFFPKRNALELPAVNAELYLQSLRDAVTYWTDSGWVSEVALRALDDSTR